MKTKDLLLLEAYKLYVSKPYDHVTFTELEKVTGLSRGAILYHYKSKELLFNAVIERFVLNDSSIGDLANENCDRLLEFVKKFLEKCKEEVRKYRSFGIYNINLAKFYVEFHALNYYKDMQQIAKKWIDDEQLMWRKVLSKAVENNEIKNDLNLDILAALFVNIYQGTSFSGISRPKGYDMVLLEKEFMTLYNLIKRN